LRPRWQPKLIEFEEARSLVLECAPPLAPETVVLRDALGRVLAEECAPRATCRRSTLRDDGFAVRASDSGAGVLLANR